MFDQSTFFITNINCFSLVLNAAGISPVGNAQTSRPVSPSFWISTRAISPADDPTRLVLVMSQGLVV
jgi:hypothetical protein